MHARSEFVTQLRALEWVGDQMFRRDLQRLGAVADVAFFRSFYLAHARQLLGHLDGTVLQIRGGARS
ncbi:MAG: hypothetical protein E6K82_14025 [Candidatus Rokuibacteriota bacterium]|nr:MAG: hypothetical protein E6K82_14025 [Candidatus Rokubacteria bacterium]